jgi:hypothetical protein
MCSGEPEQVPVSEVLLQLGTEGHSDPGVEQMVHAAVGVQPLVVEQAPDYKVELLLSQGPENEEQLVQAEGEENEEELVQAQGPANEECVTLFRILLLGQRVKVDRA